MDKPPPAGAGAVNSVGLQEAPGTEEKKSKYGKFGNTVDFLHLRRDCDDDVILLL